MRVHSHAPVSARSNVRNLRMQLAGLVKEFIWAIAAHPVLENPQMVGVCCHSGDGDLMRAPRSFYLQTVNLFGACPSFRRAQDEHWPLWSLGVVAPSCRILN